MSKSREEVLRKIEGYLKFKNITKQELAKRWKKTEVYVYRRLSGNVDLSLTDILELCEIMELQKSEAVDIFFEK